MRASTLLLLFAVGCGSLPEAPGPDPTPQAKTLDVVTTVASKQFLMEMANLADHTADDVAAGKFKAQSQVTDDFHQKSQILRATMYFSIGKKFDELVPPGKELTPADTAAAYRLMSTGFREAAK